MFFFPIFFFNNAGGIPIILATQFLNGAGAITDTDIIQFFFFFFFSKYENTGYFQNYFCRYLGKITHGNWSH